MRPKPYRRPPLSPGHLLHDGPACAPGRWTGRRAVPRVPSHEQDCSGIVAGGRRRAGGPGAGGVRSVVRRHADRLLHAAGRTGEGTGHARAGPEVARAVERLDQRLPGRLLDQGPPRPRPCRPPGSCGCRPPRRRRAAPPSVRGTTAPPASRRSARRPAPGPASRRPSCRPTSPSPSPTTSASAPTGSCTAGWPACRRPGPRSTSCGPPSASPGCGPTATGGSRGTHRAATPRCSPARRPRATPPSCA